MATDTNSALESAKAALNSANNFTHSVTGGKPSAFAPKADKPAESNYSHAREARKEPAKEFMGVRSDEAGELNTALKAREDAKQALNQ
jgi:hypothetical protein